MKTKPNPRGRPRGKRWPVKLTVYLSHEAVAKLGPNPTLKIREMVEQSI